MERRITFALALLAALLLLPSPALATITCTGTDTTKSIAVGEQGDMTVSCSGIGESQTVTVNAAGYSASCLEAKDAVPFQLTQSSPSTQITFEATSMSCENSVSDRTVTWSFSATGESISSQNTVVTITSPLSVTGSFLNSPYIVTAGNSVTITMEVSTGATVDIDDVDADLSGSTSGVYGSGKLTDWEDNTIYSSGSQKTIQKSWSFSPSTAGTYTVSAAITSQNAGGDSASTYLTVTAAGGDPDGGDPPGGGSSGGGTPAQQTARVTKQWQFMNTGEDNTMDINRTDMGFTQLRIRVRSQVQSVTMAVEALGSRPSDVGAPSGKQAFQYINITPTGISDSDIESAKIAFKVNKSWVVQNQIQVATIALDRWQVNAWQSLTTRQTGEDSTYYYFEADTPGFSYFAITGQSSAAAEQPGEQPEACNSDGYCDIGEDYDNCPSDCEPGEVGKCRDGERQCVGMVLQECSGGVWSDIETCEIGCQQGACLEPMEIDTTTLLIVVVIAVVVVVAVVVVKKRGKKPGPPKQPTIPVLSKPEGQ